MFQPNAKSKKGFTFTQPEYVKGKYPGFWGITNRVGYYPFWFEFS